MKFEQSLLSRSLSFDMRSTLAMSSHRRNPDSVLSFDAFLEQAHAFQPQSLQANLVSALTNNYEPVFTVGEVSVQIEDPLNSIESADVLFEPAMDMN